MQTVPSVLVVEDEPNIALSVRFVLERAGFAPLVATDGEEALRALRAGRPSLVLLDVMLPERDGYSLCRIIRRTPEWADLPVIMLSARGREQDREKGLAAGATDYVTKPFSTRELVERVRRALDEAPRT